MIEEEKDFQEKNSRDPISKKGKETKSIDRKTGKP